MRTLLRFEFSAILTVATVSLLAACSGSNDTSPAHTIPQLSEATPGALVDCELLPTTAAWPRTAFTGASRVAAGTLTVAGTPVGEHCLVSGYMNQRVSTVDGQTYAIRFEMRLPTSWNGRFFYQANGGTDGSVVPAAGVRLGGGPLSNALQMGFAVISSDAGHNAAQNPIFGIDPQARLDYGYNAAATLTPMAKNVIKAAYGRGPDRSYFAGCSNGGRHTMVAATRMPGEYDGYLIGDPGFHLPQAALNNMYSAQRLATVATSTTSAGHPDVSTSFTTAERALVSNAILAKCDALDGAEDGLVQDLAGCQTAFSVTDDVPTCSGARDGTCLTVEQKTVLAKIYAGAVNGAGAPLYASFPWDAGIRGGNWAFWKYTASTVLDPGAMAFIFQTPPVLDPSSVLSDTTGFALSFDMDTDAPKIFATSATYPQASMTFMVPPNVTDLSTLKQRGAKLIAYHGSSDPIFSVNDTIAWYEALRAANAGDASGFSRLYLVPGMNHCSGGPAADQFDLLTPLVSWVERGQAPDSVIATVRGAGNPGGVNADVPGTWSPTRTRSLCPYPKIARYRATGSIEDAANFVCQ